MNTLHFIERDGGRAAAGFKGTAGDCVCRAIANATGLPYREIYERLAEGNATQRNSKRKGKRGARSARDGIFTSREWFKRYMRELGFVWVPTMQIGSGCKVHLRAGELPEDKRLVVSLSRHYSAVVNGVILDTYDPSREGMRCVYGYWQLERDPLEMKRERWAKGMPAGLLLYSLYPDAIASVAYSLERLQQSDPEGFTEELAQAQRLALQMLEEHHLPGYYERFKKDQNRIQ